MEKDEIVEPKLPKQVEQQLNEIEEMEKILQSNDQQDVDIDALINSQGQEIESTEPKLPYQEEEKVNSEKLSEDFEQKYRSLKGKYDKEVPELHQQVRALSSDLNLLNNQIKNIEERKEVPKESENTMDNLVTDEDREEFGEDLLNVQRRVAQEVVREYTQKLEQQNQNIDKIQKDVNKTGTDVEDMVFRQRLNYIIPDFEQINQDKKWIEWLDTVDPILQSTRRVPAEKAYQNRDSDFIANYVNLYKQNCESFQQTPETLDSRQSEIEKQVAPSNSVTPDVRVNNEKRTLTQQQADKLWKSVKDLNMSGKYERAEKLENELTAALMEGRII